MNNFRTILLISIYFPSYISLGETADPHERATIVFKNVPDIPHEIVESVSRRHEFGSSSFLDWAGDGLSMLIATRVGTLSQVHRLAAPLGTLQQLTFSAKSLGSAISQPGGDGFVYAKDNDGDEYYQLYYQNTRTGDITLITDGRKSRNLGALWSKDGKQLAYLHSPQGSNRYQIRIAPAISLRDPKTILDRDGSFSVDDWSPDGRTLLVSRFVSMNESYIYALSVADGHLREINPQQPIADRISYNGGQYPQFLGGLTGGPPRGGRFSRDSKSVFVISDQSSEFAHIEKIDISNSKRTKITEEILWDVDSFDISPDGSTIIYSVNENGLSKLHIIDAVTASTSIALPLPAGVIGNRSFDRDGNQFAFTFFGWSGPPEIYTIRMRDKSLVRWTSGRTEGLDAAVKTKPEVIQFPSFDRRMISAFLYRPEREERLPVIVHIHGGPESQYRPMFSLYGPVVSGLELGFAVMAPNVRGSTGYGKTFVALDNGLNREDAVNDIGGLLDWIAQQPFLDKDRVVLHGISYGGYMVNASVANYSSRLSGGISVVAISDFYSFLNNTAEYRRDLRRAEYGDERDPRISAFMHRIAPLARVDKMTAPMFIVHGSNDPRVPVSEAERLYSALQASGRTPWLMIAQDEGHGFQKQSSVAQLDMAVMQFLKEVALSNPQRIPAARPPQGKLRREERASLGEQPELVTSGAPSRLAN